MASILTQLFALLSNVKIIRLLGPENYGIYAFVLSQYLLFSTISTFGIRNIQIKRIAVDSSNTKNIFFSALIIQSLGLIISLTFFFMYDFFIGSNCSNYLFLFISCIILNNIWDICESIWYGYQKMLIPSLINIGNSLIWVIVILVLPSHQFTINTLLAIFAFLFLIKVSVSVFFIFYRKMLQGVIHNIFKEVILLVKNSLPLYLNILVTLPTNYLSNNFLEIRSSESQLGYFNANNKLIHPITTAINLTVTAIFPRLSQLWQKDKDSFFEKIQTGLSVFIVIFSLLATIVSLFKLELVEILFGEDFTPVANIIMYQVWFIVIFGINGITGMIWVSIDKQALVAKYGILNSIIATPLLWIGSSYGAEGLSICYLLAYMLFFPILWYKFNKTTYNKIRLRKEFVCFIVLMLFSLLSKEFPLSGRILSLIVIFVTLYVLFRKSFIRLLKNEAGS